MSAWASFLMLAGILCVLTVVVAAALMGSPVRDDPPPRWALWILALGVILIVAGLFGWRMPA